MFIKIGFSVRLGSHRAAQMKQEITESDAIVEEGRLDIMIFCEINILNTLLESQTRAPFHRPSIIIL